MFATTPVAGDALYTARGWRRVPHSLANFIKMVKNCSFFGFGKKNMITTIKKRFIFCLFPCVLSFWFFSKLRTRTVRRVFRSQQAWSLFLTFCRLSVCLLRARLWSCFVLFCFFFAPPAARRRRHADRKKSVQTKHRSFVRKRHTAY